MQKADDQTRDAGGEEVIDLIIAKQERKHDKQCRVAESQ